MTSFEESFVLKENAHKNEVTSYQLYMRPQYTEKIKPKSSINKQTTNVVLDED